LSVAVKIMSSGQSAETTPMSRKTPPAVARELRKEAGFGCCECGSPILQYHHIVEWAEDHHFRTKDMMALCPNHHDQATKGAMPEAEQRALKANPWNIRHQMAKGLLAVRQNYCAVDFGAVSWVGEGPCLRIDGEDIFGLTLDDGNLAISLRLFSQDGERLVEIDRNEWIAGDPLPWDIEADWQRLTIRNRSRNISLSLNAKANPLELRAQFWFNRRQIDCSPDGVTISVAQRKGKVVLQELSIVGAPLEIVAENINLASNGKIVVAHDRRQRLLQAKDVWFKLKRERQALI
jgi:hypothetical protein